ncbi:hypothetical protein FOHLNKBM_5981 [Methylobacterium longum]|nr:hypothetical protein FOHLNKBM_5981 [Methylobacterium longum]
MEMGQPYKPHPISLNHACSMFDPSQLYGALQQHGITAAGAPRRSGSRAG